MVGPPGVGKNPYLSGYRLCRRLQRLLGFYRSSFDLVADMAEAHRNSARKELVSKLSEYNLLIIDEFGIEKHAAKCSGRSA